MEPFFTAANVRVAYQTRFHFGWYSHNRTPFEDRARSTMLTAFQEVAERRNYHALESDLEPCALRALLSLTPGVSPAEVTRYVKGNVATAVRDQHQIARLWSRGWFVRSVGAVTNEVVRTYVADQYRQHDAALAANREANILAGHASAADASELRTSNHAAFEYNLHVVLVTQQRRQVLDLEVAEQLVSYMRQVCERKQWLLWNVQVVWNHMHLFLGLSPDDAPQDVALSLLNNAEFFLQRRFAAMLRDEVERTFWQPGFYVGTVGSATTAQVKAFLG